ncbi:probable LRR receptor-like serine/threonine-protein kinase At1g07650 [Cryptomeria japonica]|uniref:probable LRR receptor-like serine/threonine-protein kinase At1g07650 n=1 Tax=Cryptomeria japonica TaxID=3369 RepID=UPI0027DA7128|nr:probable LRR receptor-like serine/threonine-protein kinase At1g07650 [Cryptomeria japonica]
MASYTLLIILCSTFMFFSFFKTKHAKAALSQDEFGALKAVASKLVKVDWDFSGYPCTGTGFKGLTCDSVNGSHVTNITLPQLNLEGELSPELAKLSHLIGLRVQNRVKSTTFLLCFPCFIHLTRSSKG